MQLWCVHACACVKCPTSLHSVTCQLITINDGTAYNSVEIVWNAQPKNLVYMSPYLLAFTANTIEIRMASNGSLMQTIQTPDLKLLSMKVCHGLCVLYMIIIV